MRSRLVAQLDLLARSWIGYTRPLVHEAINDSWWVPDSPTSFCSRCGASIGRGEQTKSGCGSCRGHAPLADHVVRLGAYEHELRSWVVAIKFGRWVHMATALGRLLGESVLRDADIDRSRTIIVPAPMPTIRKLDRGIDHARLIAEGVRTTTRVRIYPILGARNTLTQISLSHAERLRRGGRAMFVRRTYRKLPLQGRDVILVDDVRTTGATLRAMQRHLAPLKPRRIIVAVVAVADDKARRARTTTKRRIPPETSA